MNIISLYLFKRLADNMSGFPLSKQGSIMIQELTSVIELITVSWMLKAVHVAVLLYLALKSPLKMAISMYYMFYKRDKYTDN